MFDIVRRRQYRSWRVMIDSARVLDSPFADTLICLSGAEQELLRNLTQYLRRQDTFVATYLAQHYLTPDADAWDALQAVVAGLEEKLMGCAELEELITSIAEGLAAYPLLGAPTVYAECIYTVCDNTGNMLVELDTVPANTIRTCSRLVAQNTEHSPTAIQFEFVASGGWRFAERWENPPAYEPVGWVHEVVMMPGERWQVRYQGVPIGDNLRTTIVALDRLIVE